MFEVKNKNKYICIHGEKKLNLFSLCPLRPKGGIKALTDMSAKNVILFLDGST